MLDDSYAFVPFTLDTEVNWMRNIENQLDWAHLPFVHRTTLGADFPRHVDVRSTVEGDLLTSWIRQQARQQRERRPSLVD